MTAIAWGFIHIDRMPSSLPWNVVVHVSGEDGRWKGAWALGDGTVFGKTRDGRSFGLLTLEE